MKTWIPAILLCGALIGLWFFHQAKTRGLAEEEVEKLHEKISALNGLNENLRNQITALRSPVVPPQPEAWVSEDDDAVMGDKNAPLTLIEFSEFQCPYCARFTEETFWRIKRDYIDTGRLRFVFRDFPLSFHEYAAKAAEAAECADDQGMFWEMQELLFANHTQIGPDDLKHYAEKLGLFMPDFNFCMESGKNAAEVQKDIQDGARAGVTSTPSFFLGLTGEGGRIQGTLIKGAKPFEVFRQMIEAKLSEAGKGSETR